jgi:hypothetical protein
MPTPLQVWTQIPVHGTFLNVDLTPAQGSVVFRIKNIADIANNVIVPSQVILSLAANGYFSANLFASNDPNLSPSGWAYEVVEDFAGGRPPYYLIIPTSAVNTGIDLATITPIFFSAPENGAASASAANAAVSALAANTSAVSAANSATAAANSATAAAASAGASVLSLKASLAITSANNVATVNLNAAQDFILTATQDVTSWVYQNLPAAGFIKKIRIVIIQNAVSAKTIASPATAGHTAGGPWIANTGLGSIQALDCSVDSAGVVTVVPTPVQS